MTSNLNLADLLHLRSRGLSALRQWGKDQELMEVDVPWAVPSPCLEPHLDGPEVHWQQAGEAGGRFLPTSPELALKKYLAAGVGECFALGPAFRDEPPGRLHVPEFLMLEWYRLTPDLGVLAKDLSSMLAALTGAFADQSPWRRGGKPFFPGKPITTLTYREVMQGHGAVDPDRLLEMDPVELSAWCAGNLGVPAEGWSADDVLNYLFLTRVEPHLGWESPALITHYPASQAALSRLDPEDPSLCLRAELFIAGVELANGYVELTDGEELKKRTKGWQAERRAEGKSPHPEDHGFLAAMDGALPPCAGMALGVDRLWMLLWNQQDLQQVRPLFRGPRAAL